MSKFDLPDDDEGRIAAVLHDVVEDCGITLAILGTLGYPPNVIEAIDALSRRKGEAYDAYIGRVVSNPLAARIKERDLLDNLDPARIISDELRRRYLRAYRRIQALTPIAEAGGG